MTHTDRHTVASHLVTVLERSAVSHMHTTCAAAQPWKVVKTGGRDVRGNCKEVLLMIEMA